MMTTFHYQRFPNALQWTTQLIRLFSNDAFPHNFLSVTYKTVKNPKKNRQKTITTKNIDIYEMLSLLCRCNNRVFDSNCERSYKIYCFKKSAISSSLFELDINYLLQQDRFHGTQSSITRPISAPVRRVVSLMDNQEPVFGKTAQYRDPQLQEVYPHKVNRRVKFDSAV